MRFHRVLIPALFLAGCGAGGEPEFENLGGLGNHAMILPDGANPADLPGWAKDRCGAASQCSIYAWADRAQAARAVPLTDAEVASLAFRYDVNRTTGFERALWDCERFARPDRADCL